MTTEIELAWCAGFFDGGGSTFVSRNMKGDTRLRLCLSIGQTDIRPLERFFNAVELGYIRGPYVPTSRPHVKPSWRYTVNGVIAVPHVLRLMWPYLCAPKKAQANDCIRQYKESRR